VQFAERLHEGVLALLKIAAMNQLIVLLYCSLAHLLLLILQTIFKQWENPSTCNSSTDDLAQALDPVQ
jgi:hypothetical protein